MKKSNLALLLSLVFLFFPISVRAQSLDVKYETLPDNLLLVNIEDYSSALVHMELDVRAGFSAQEIRNAGFFLLYNRLFFSTQKEEYEKLLSVMNITSSQDADAVKITADVPYGLLGRYIDFLSSCLSSPSFSDEDIKRELDSLKSLTKDYSTTTTGFINTAIDSVMFSENPWKTESGIYPELLNSYTEGQVRTILEDIRKRYYTPDNSALFVSGPVGEKELYSLCSKGFKSWNSFYNGSSIEKDERLSKEEHRKFVLTSPYFSKSMTQLVVQFTDFTMEEADVLSAAFNSVSSPLRQNVLASSDCGIKRADYIACSSVQQKGFSRLIMQAIGVSSEDTNPVKQAEAFTECAVDSCLMEEGLFDSYRETVLSKYLTQKGNPRDYISLLSSFWTVGSGRLEESLEESVSKKINNLSALDSISLASKAQESEPYVFVLVNSATYTKNKKAFDEKGYKNITRENAGWYLKEEKLKESLAEKQEQEALPEEILEADGESLTPAMRFARANEGTIQTVSLSNGIPVVIKEDEGEENVTVLLGINQGEAGKSARIKGLNTIILNYFALNIQNEVSLLRLQNLLKGESSIKARTDIASSLITINCYKEDLGLILKAAVDAIIFGEITPSKADRLVYEQKEQWSLQDSSLVRQMKNNALEYLYKGTSFETYYDSDTPYLKSTDYLTIENAYTSFLDASLYSIIIDGSAKAEDILGVLEESFGMLKKQKERTETELPSPVFRNKTRNIQLKHTYTTDRDSSEASKDSPILVPTSTFEDPVIYIFSAPTDTSSLSLYNALLFALNRKISFRLKAKGLNTKTGFEEAGQDVPLGMLYAESILHTNDFLNAYRASLSELEAELKDSGSETVEMLKAKWVTDELTATQSTEGKALLILKGLNEGKAGQYIDDYIFLENAAADDYIKILKAYFSSTPLFQVFSVDSKK